MKRFVFYVLLVIVLFHTSANAGLNELVIEPDPIDAPGATITVIRSMYEETFVGTYYTDAHYGFYNDGLWNTLSCLPGSGHGVVCGYDGSSMVGYYYEGSTSHAFEYDGVSCYSLKEEIDDYFGATGSTAFGIDEGIIAGSYAKEGKRYGFIYDGSDPESFEFTGAIQTNLNDIDGSNLVGDYTDSSGHYHGFLNDTPIDVPGSTDTTVLGIDGSYLVGYSLGLGHKGFFYDYINNVWTTVEVEGAVLTEIEGIYENVIVGTYSNDGSNYHGFIYEIPEPATILILTLGGIVLRRRNQE